MIFSTRARAMSTTAIAFASWIVTYALPSAIAMYSGSRSSATVGVEPSFLLTEQPHTRVDQLRALSLAVEVLELLVSDEPGVAPGARNR